MKENLLAEAHILRVEEGIHLGNRRRRGILIGTSGRGCTGPFLPGLRTTQFMKLLKYRLRIVSYADIAHSAAVAIELHLRSPVAEFAESYRNNILIGVGHFTKIPFVHNGEAKLLLIRKNPNRKTYCMRYMVGLGYWFRRGSRLPSHQQEIFTFQVV